MSKLSTGTILKNFFFTFVKSDMHSHGWNPSHITFSILYFSTAGSESSHTAQQSYSVWMEEKRMTHSAVEQQFTWFNLLKIMCQTFLKTGTLFLGWLKLKISSSLNPNKAKFRQRWNTFINLLRILQKYLLFCLNSSEGLFYYKATPNLQI